MKIHNIFLHLIPSQVTRVTLQNITVSCNCSTAPFYTAHKLRMMVLATLIA